jgi:hypothetical protein
MRGLQRTLALSALCGLGACSGGGSTATPQGSAARGNLVLIFPNATAPAARAKRPLFLSPSAMSVSISVSGIAQPVVADVTASSPQCGATESGRTCSIGVAAPVGTDTFTATLYAGANATGAVLGTGSAVQQISAGAPFSVTLGVAGDAASIALSVAQKTFTAGVKASTTITVVASDAGGNVITGTYASPVMLTNSDTTGTFTISPQSVANSTTTVRLTYSGGTAAKTAMISASAANVPSTSVMAQVVTVEPTPTPSPTPTASPSPSPTPATPTPSPTRTPTPTPSPTHTPSPTPTPTPTPTHTPTPTPTPTATPTPASTELFIADGLQGGVSEYQASSGVLKQNFAQALPVGQVDLDDAGYVFTFLGGTATSSPKPELSKVAIGGNTVLATYAPTAPETLALGVSPEGELVVAGLSGTSRTYDIWDRGVTGKPSRTLTYPDVNGNTQFEFALGPDGALIVPYQSNDQQKFDIIPRGKSTPSRTIVDAIARSPQSFTPNWMAVDAEGTLYVGEWSYTSGDPDAGLYVYPKTGPERCVTSMGPGINGLDLDAAGNVYVAINNGTYEDGGTPYTADNAQQVFVYSPGAKTLLRQFSDGTPGIFWLTAGDDGAIYLVQYPNEVANGPTAVGEVLRVAPGASSASVLVPNVISEDVSLYDGSHAKQALLRSKAVHVVGGHGPFGGRFARRFRRTF